jgi:hypothetical protein
MGLGTVEKGKPIYRREILTHTQTKKVGRRTKKGRPP